MGFILFLLILIIVMTAALMLPLKFRVQASLDNNGKFLNVFFLYPLLKINVTFDGGVILKVFLLKNRIMKKTLKVRRGKGNSLAWLKSAVVTNRKADISFGLKNPFSTSMISGALGAASAVLKLDEMSLHPDFFSAEDYLRAEASAEITLGNTIINYVKNKRKKNWRKNEWSKA